MSLDARPRRAVLVPEPDYPATAPLLWFAAETLGAAGWEVGEAGDGELGEMELVVAKSPTVTVIAQARSCSAAGIWLTPDLTDPDVVAGLAAIERPGLAVGSTADPTWSVGASAQLRRMEVLQLTEADHHLQVPGDPERSLELLTRIVARARALIHRLG